MKKAKGFLLLLLVLNLANLACDKDDDSVTSPPEVINEPEPEQENQAPGVFSLLEIKDKDTAVTLTPTFRWNTSTDPDGDVVSYDLLLGEDENALSFVVTDLNTTSYKVNDRLSLFTEYFWNVIAKDDKGKETSSDIFSFTARNLNQPETATNPDAQFLGRMLHTVVLFKNRLWLYGGQNRGDILVDLWSSDDGITWQGGDDPDFAPVRGHTAVAFQDTLWVLGGGRMEFGSRTNNLVPTSGNGLYDAPYKAPWSGREFHTSVVFKDKLWVLGGVDNDSNLLNDVWFTNEVKTWDPNSYDTASWEGRYGHSSVVFDDKLWVIGGYDGKTNLNDVWYTDGTTQSDGALKWEFVPQENRFPKRLFHQTVAYDNKIWLFGGSGNRATGPMNDIWYSEDGANWELLTQDAKFPARFGHTLTVFKDELLMIGGNGANDGPYNDVWVFD